MSRAINEDKLCSAFYQCHDFLNFDYKKYNKFLHPLVKNNISGIKNMPDGNKTFNESSNSNIEQYNSEQKILGGYAHKCSMEYEKWLNSLKFQFDHRTLHSIMPKDAVLNNFFGDLHIRTPHEQTLLINHSKQCTFIVSVHELKTKDFLNRLRKDYGRGNNKSTKYQELMKDKSFSYVYESIENLGTESVLSCRLTVHTNVSKSDIYKPERFSNEILDAITGTRILHYPMTAIFPNGVRISELDEEQSAPPIMLHDIVQLQQYNNAWFMPMTNPFTSEQIEGQDLWWDRNETKSMSKKAKRTYKTHSLKESSYTVWSNIRQTLIHISVLTHPEFRDFCVSTLKRKGLQPNKTPYSADNPYKLRPAWKPPFEHYMVTINVPDEVSNEAQSSTHKKRHHLVRGHLMRSSGIKSRDGFVWRKSHWRGNKKLGTITKDYTMKIDERIHSKAS